MYFCLVNSVSHLCFIIHLLLVSCIYIFYRSLIKWSSCIFLSFSKIELWMKHFYQVVRVKHGFLQKEACVFICAYKCILGNVLCLRTAPAGSEGRRRSREEEEEEALKRKQLQEEHLSKVGEMQ